jgi:hypothetical protein
LETGRPVFTFGGFTGRDALVDLDGFIEMIDGGELRHVLGLPQQKPEIARWVRRNCREVAVPGVVLRGEGRIDGPLGGQDGVLFDCRPDA